MRYKLKEEKEVMKTDEETERFRRFKKMKSGTKSFSAKYDTYVPLQFLFYAFFEVV